MCVRDLRLGKFRGLKVKDSVEMYMEHTRVYPNARVRVKDEGDDSWNVSRSSSSVYDVGRRADEVLAAERLFAVYG